jgi:predicted flap endonuclease-1-like 5' DNA nuclease
VYAKKLHEKGITTTDDLLERGMSPQGRKEISEGTEISEQVILRWVNMADLFRIKGIGEEYSQLLEAAGVDTVPELSQRNAQNLYDKLNTVNEEKKLVRQVPALTKVSEWIEQAKNLPRKVEY